MAELLLQHYLTKIEELLQSDRYGEATAHCRQVLRFFPWHAATYCLMGQACLESEDLQEAVDCFLRALSADPENPAAWTGLGRARDEQGMFLEAIRALQRAVELAPGDAGVRAHLQHLCAQVKGQGDGPLELTHGALGRLYLRSGLLDQAIDQLQAACEGSLSWPGTQLALAEALWQAERYPAALENSLEVLQSLPHCLKANLIAGAIHMRDGQSDAAEARFRIAQVVDPENRMAWRVLGPGFRLPAVNTLIPELETESVPPEAEDETQGSAPAQAIAAGRAEPAGPAAEGAIEEAPADQPGEPVAELAYPSDVPAGLKALVDAGALNEVDLKVALAELAAIRSGAGQLQGLSDPTADLQTEEDLAAWVQELILPSMDDGAP